MWFCIHHHQLLKKKHFWGIRKLRDLHSPWESIPFGRTLPWSLQPICPELWHADMPQIFCHRLRKLRTGLGVPSAFGNTKLTQNIHRHAQPTFSGFRVDTVTETWGHWAKPSVKHHRKNTRVYIYYCVQETSMHVCLCMCVQACKTYTRLV